MLSSLVKEHQAKQAVKRDELGKIGNHCINSIRCLEELLTPTFFSSENNRKEAIAASSELTQALVDHLNVG